MPTRILQFITSSHWPQKDIPKYFCARPDAASPAAFAASFLKNILHDLHLLRMTPCPAQTSKRPNNFSNPPNRCPFHAKHMFGLPCLVLNVHLLEAEPVRRGEFRFPLGSSCRCLLLYVRSRCQCCWQTGRGQGAMATGAAARSSNQVISRGLAWLQENNGTHAISCHINGQKRRTQWTWWPNFLVLEHNLAGLLGYWPIFGDVFFVNVGVWCVYIYIMMV